MLTIRRCIFSLLIVDGWNEEAWKTGGVFFRKKILKSLTAMEKTHSRQEQLDSSAAMWGRYQVDLQHRPMSMSRIPISQELLRV